VRKSNLFFGCATVALSLFTLMFLHAGWRQRADSEMIEGKRLVVAGLKLTDLCLFTDARYARHLSQADLNTPFQDHPLSLEHFPSGSLVSPPRTLLRSYEKLD
jgi:hypothetical protein